MLLVGRVNLGGRSVGGRGAGPGFMNCSDEYMLLWSVNKSPGSEKDGDGAVTYFPYEVIVQGISQVAQGVRRGVGKRMRRELLRSSRPARATKRELAIAFGETIVKRTIPNVLFVMVFTLTY